MVETKTERTNPDPAPESEPRRCAKCIAIGHKRNVKPCGCVDFYRRFGHLCWYRPSCDGCGNDRLLLDAKRGELVCTDCGMVAADHWLADQPDQLALAPRKFKRDANGRRVRIGYSTYIRQFHVHERLRAWCGDEPRLDPDEWELFVDMAETLAKFKINPADPGLEPSPEVLQATLEEFTREDIQLVCRLVRREAVSAGEPERFPNNAAEKWLTLLGHLGAKVPGPPRPYYGSRITNEIAEGFRVIQIPYDRIQRTDYPDRKNFLNFNYVFCQLLELLARRYPSDAEVIRAYRVHFPTLRTPAKIAQHNEIWAKICDAVGWEFIKFKP